MVEQEEIDAALESWEPSGINNCTQTQVDLLWNEVLDNEGNLLVEDIGVLAQFLECGWNSSDPVQYFWKVVFQDSSFSVSTTSLYSFDSSPNYLNDTTGYLVVDQAGGFQSIVETMASTAGISPIFNRRVLKIKYDYYRDEYRALVYVVDSKSGGNITIYEAKRVISTVAAQVWNEGLIAVEPALRYDASTYNPMMGRNFFKVFCQFSTAFWNTTSYIWTVDSEQNAPNISKPVFWVNMNRFLPGSNMLMLVLFEESFEAFAGTDNLRQTNISTELLGTLMEPLQLAYTDVYEPPIHYYHNSWHSDVRTGYKAYADWKVGYTPWDYYAFYGGVNDTHYYIQADCEHNGCNGEPDDNATEWILYMSGSASCLEYWENVHGAYYAGEVSANYMLESLNYTEDEMGFWYDICYYGHNETYDALIDLENGI